MQTELLVPDSAFALSDWGEGFWAGDPAPVPTMVPIFQPNDSEDTSSEYVPANRRRPTRAALSQIPVHLLHVRETLHLPGTDIDFASIEVEYKGRVIERCWKDHKPLRRFGETAIRMNCDVHHMLGRPPRNWRTDSRRFILLRYTSAEGPRELRVHVHSGKTYPHKTTKH